MLRVLLVAARPSLISSADQTNHNDPSTPRAVSRHVCLSLLVILTLASSSACQRPDGGKQQQEIIQGQVFIVTRGGENLKLGLVTVALYPQAVIRAHFRAKRDRSSREMSTRDSELTRADNALRSAEKSQMVARAKAHDMTGRYIVGEVTTEEYWTSNRILGVASGRVQKLAAQRDALVQDYVRWTAAEFYYEGLPHPETEAKTDADGKFSVTVPRSGSYLLAARAERETPTEKYFWIVPVTEDMLKRGSVFLSNDNLMPANPPASWFDTLLPRSVGVNEDLPQGSVSLQQHPPASEPEAGLSLAL